MTNDVSHSAFGGSHIVNRMIMQMPDVSATKPVKIHDAAFCHQFGFTIRFNKAATASLGSEKETMPRVKSI